MNPSRSAPGLRAGVCTGLSTGSFAGISRCLSPLLLLAPLLVGLVPASSAAADVVIGFDDLAGFTAVTTQYAAQGVTFKSSPAQPWVRADSKAPSAPNGLAIRHFECTGEFCTNFARGEFSQAHEKVSVRVGTYAATENTKVVLTAYDAAMAVVGAQEVTIDAMDAAYATLSISAGSARIVAFEVSAPLNKRVILDDLTFDASVVPIPADFSLTWNESLSVPLAKGQSRATSLTLHRAGPSSGTIFLGLSGLPSGVTGTLSPNPLNGGNGSTFTLTLTAAPDAPPVSDVAITVTGTPDASSGPAPRSTVVRATVADSFDARLSGIEVTQGIQTFDQPRLVGGAVGVQSYSGVTLVAGLKTVVRVFANLRVSPSTKALPPVEVTLKVCDAAGSSCSAPIPAEQGKRLLKPGEAAVSDDVRAAPDEAFTFVLPMDRVKGSATLQAELHPPSFFEGSELRECETLLCKENNRFVLSGLTFQQSGPVLLRPVALKTRYGTLRAPPRQFEEIRNLLPTPDIRIPPSYDGEIGVTDVMEMTRTGTDPEAIDLTPEMRGKWILQRLIDRADEWNFYETDGLVVGVYDQSMPSRAYARRSARTAIVRGAAEKDAAPDRPLSSIGHEVVHLLGKPHASTACGADDGEDWAPDQQGYLQGVGLDRRGGLWRVLSGASGPYRLLAPKRDGGTPRFYDLMSYCGRIGGGDPEHWLSVRNWNALAASLRSGDSSTSTGGAADPASGDAAGSAPSGSSAVTGDSVIVRGFTLPDGRVFLTKVGPGRLRAASSSAGAASAAAGDYRLLARDRAGKTLHDVAMTASAFDADPGEDHSQPGLQVEAQLPFTGVEQLELWHGDVQVASRSRAKQRLELRLGRVELGQGGDARLEWQSSGGHPDALVKVDFSADSGDWRPLYLGPNEKRLQLERALFPGAKCGRFRVRVNDGFDEVSAQSGCLDVPHRGPSVRVLSPVEGEKFRNGTLLLQGDAYDEGKQRLGAQQLRWTLEGEALGSGESLSRLEPLPEGRSVLTLVATDGAGREGTATLEVSCDAQGVCLAERLSADDELLDPRPKGCGCGSLGSGGSGDGDASGLAQLLLLLAVGALLRRRPLEARAP